MLTKADDYPIHQLPEPIAYAGSDNNFYDRYFFNGYSKDGEVFFGAAMGVYPHRDITDAAFCVAYKGVQYNLHASRQAGPERMDTFVGPIEVKVLEPLQKLQVIVSENEHGITADLTFDGLIDAFQEPRFTLRKNKTTIMDLTRLTQSGSWHGWIEIEGTRIEINANNAWGTRDRSWGVRLIAGTDTNFAPVDHEVQFFWLWNPVNFDNYCTFYHSNHEADGTPWNELGLILPTRASGLPDPGYRVKETLTELSFIKGSRYIEKATMTHLLHGGGEIVIEQTPQYYFMMPGLGYQNKEWGHAIYKGKNVTGFDTYVLDEVNKNDIGFQHLQAYVTATMQLPDGQVHKGSGVLEQLLLGRHTPTGLTGLIDPA